MDECHHVLAAAFSHVMNQIQARYWLGLTATPYRRDRLDSLIYHQLGQISHTNEPAPRQQLPSHAGEIAESALELELHRTSYTYAGTADPSEPGGISAIYKDLIADEARLQQIYDDVMAAYAQNSRILVLTTWKAHLDSFRSRFEAAELNPVVFTGAMKAKERQAAVDLLAGADDEQPLLVLGTGSYIGEGFDCPSWIPCSLQRQSRSKVDWSNTSAALSAHTRERLLLRFTTIFTNLHPSWQRR